MKTEYVVKQVTCEGRFTKNHTYETTIALNPEGTKAMRISEMKMTTGTNMRNGGGGGNGGRTIGSTSSMKARLSSSTTDINVKLTIKLNHLPSSDRCPVNFFEHDTPTQVDKKQPIG